MKRLFFSICLLLLIIHQATSITANCNFSITKFTFVGSIYYCEVSNSLNIISPASNQIETVIGTHESEKSNSDVLGLKIDNKNTQYFPAGFDKFFSNLQVLMITNGRLKELYASDLKPFPQLVVLSVYGNDIEILEKGLFDNNPNLSGVWFYINKILYIDYFVFETLTKLNYIDLSSNLCINKMGSYSKNAVQAVIDTARITCQDHDYYAILTRLRQLEEDAENLNAKSFKKFKENFEEFEELFNDSGLAKYPFLQERVDNLRKLIEEWNLGSDDDDDVNTTTASYDNCTEVCQCGTDSGFVEDFDDLIKFLRTFSDDELKALELL